MWDLTTARGIARKTGLNWNIKDNRHSIEIRTLRDVKQSLPMLAPQVGRVGNRHPSQGEPLLNDEVHYVERVTRHALIRRIVKHQAATLVGGDHLSWREVFTRPGRFAAPGRSAEHDKTVSRDDDFVQGDRWLSGHFVCINGVHEVRRVSDGVPGRAEGFAESKP